MTPFLIAPSDTTVAIAKADPYAVEGASYTRNMSEVYALAPSALSNDIRVLLDNIPFANTTIKLNLLPPTHIRGVLRTSTIFVDRSIIRVQYQVYRGDTSVAVSPPTRVDLIVNGVSIACDVTGAGCVDNCDAARANQYLVGCSSTAAAVGLLFSTSVTEHSVQMNMTSSAGTSLIGLGNMTLAPTASWWNAALRTSSATAVAPFVFTAANGVSNGVYGTTPHSPVYCNEQFDIELYAEASNEINNWRLQVSYDSDVLEYACSTCTLKQSDYFEMIEHSDAVGGVINGQINGTARTVTLSTRGQTSATIGLAQAVRKNALTATVYLASVPFKFKCSAANATYTDRIEILVKEMSDALGAALVESPGRAGKILDRRDTAQATGGLTLRAPSTVQVFGYAETEELAVATVLNKATFGVSTIVSLVAAAVDDDDRIVNGQTAVTPSSCTVTATGLSTSIASACQLSVSANASSATHGLVLEYASRSAVVSLAIHSPTVQLTVDDATLQRVASSSINFSACADQAYQYTRAHVIVDGRDLTSMLTLVSLNTSIVAIREGNVVYGVTPGVTAVHIQSMPSLSVTVEVSTSPVHVASMTARLISSASLDANSATLTHGGVVSPVFTMKNTLHSEGASGRIFARIAWTDGAKTSVAYANRAGVDELSVQSHITDSLVATAPTTNGVGLLTSLWSASIVPDGAPQCNLQGLLVNWTVCGQTLATTDIPVHLVLPAATNLTLHDGATELSAVRADVILTSPTDDASLVGIPVAFVLGARVAYDYGPVRDRTGDSRLAVDVDDPNCGRYESNMIYVKAGAACDNFTVTVNGTFGGVELSATAMIGLAYVVRADVAFKHYDSHDSHIAGLTRLGRIHCLGALYHRAVPTMQLTISNYASRPSVTYATTFYTNDTGIATISGVNASSVVHASAAGAVSVQGRFSSTVGASPLQIVDDVNDIVVALSWGGCVNCANAYNNPSPLSVIVNHTREARVTAHFKSGNVWYGIGHDNLAWVRLSDMISFTSDKPDIFSVDENGTHTLFDNWYQLINSTATMKCADNVSTTRELAANLLPDVLDVDLGGTSGLQFVQSDADIANNELHVDIYVNAGTGYLKSFQIELEMPSDSSGQLALKVEGEDTFTAAPNAFPGATFQTNNPASLWVIIAAHATSELTGTVFIGTLKLSVKREGVFLMRGTIVNMVVYDDSGTRVETYLTPIAAGLGYAEVHMKSSRRRLRVLGPITPPTMLEYHSLRPQRRLQPMDACTEGVVVKGDVNGDGQFLASDVLDLQRLIVSSSFLEFESALALGNTSATDPLDADDFDGRLNCESRRLAHNPTLDFHDATRQMPRVNSDDVSHLMRAVVKLYRIIDMPSMSCVPSTLDTPTQEVRLALYVFGGRHTNTEVYVHVRIPGVQFFNVTTGTVVRRANLGANDVLVRAINANSTTGLYTVQLQPYPTYPSGRYEVEMVAIVETLDADGAKHFPYTHKAWYGTDAEPYNLSLIHI